MVLNLKKKGAKTMMPIKMTLKALRVNKGLSRSKASELIGVSPDTLANYERGKSFPDVPIIKNIEKTYGVEYKDIIFLV